MITKRVINIPNRPPKQPDIAIPQKMVEDKGIEPLCEACKAPAYPSRLIPLGR